MVHENRTSTAPSRQKMRVQTSVRERGGVRFQPVREQRLMPAARQTLSEVAGERSLLALAEFNSPFGVPDVTAVIGGDAERTRRLRSGIPALLNEADAGIVSAASPSIRRSAKQLAYYLRWPIETIERRVPGLLSTGALVESGSGYVADPSLVAWGEIMAVELKINDWKRAIRQCRRYSLWSNSYILVTDQISAGSLQALMSEVRSDRGGLVIDGERLLSPEPRPLHGARQLWATEHVVAELQARRDRIRSNPQ